jgi:hypothetical protein
MSKIPFYYIPYVVIFLEKKKLWNREEAFFKVLEEQNIPEQIIAQIKALTKEENGKEQELNKQYIMNKNLHVARKAVCCGFHRFYQDAISNRNINNMGLTVNVSSEKGIELKEFSEFTKKCSNLSMYLRSSSKVSTISQDDTQVLKQNDLKCEIEIEFMSEYKDEVVKKKPLRNPFLFDNEIRQIRYDFFGNPFDPYVAKTENELAQIRDNPNASINDGESVFMNSEHLLHNHKKQNESNNENNVINRKTQRSYSSDDESTVSAISSSTSKSNQLCKNSKIDRENSINLIKNNLSIKRGKTKSFDLSANTEPLFSNTLQLEEETISEFKSLFNKDIYERNGLRIVNKYSLDINILLDWKLQNKLKDCNIFIKLLDSQQILKLIKSNDASLVNFYENLLDQPALFYTEKQKIQFTEKVLELCLNFGANKMFRSYFIKKLGKSNLGAK